jgi:hypothetical protein
MLLSTFLSRVEDKEAQGEFTLALVTDDYSEMVRWAKRFTDSIRTGSPESHIPDESQIREWEQKSLQFLEEKPSL